MKKKKPNDKDNKANSHQGKGNDDGGATPRTPREGRPEGMETYPAPPPPSKGRIIGLDCHPDTFTAAVLRGSTVYDAERLECRTMTLAQLMAWAAAAFTSDDLFLMEAGSNSFEICRRLHALGLRAVVLESAYVGKHATSHADNDRMAAERIAMVFLGGKAPCVWQPDAVTLERRELLHAYTVTVAGHVAAGNELKGYLNQYAVRLGKRNPNSPKTRAWILKQRDWSELQLEILSARFLELDHHVALRKKLSRLIGREVANEPLMLGCMRLLGIGMVNAFALLALIGDIKRFAHAGKLVAYFGLNPGQKESGHGKRKKVGTGGRGRGDMRALLVQGAQAVLRMGKRTSAGAWGMKLLLRKGSRNIAVVAVARKLAVQVWHMLSGNPPQDVETGKSLTVKLGKLAVTLGKVLRKELSFPPSLTATVEMLRSRIIPPASGNTA
jgi:transposase